MGKDKLVLADNTTIELETTQGIGALTVNAESKAVACALWEKFTPSNLEQISIKNSDGLIVGKYQNMVLDHVTGTDNNGIVQVTFSLRNKTAEEILTERVDALEAGQQTQDGAIEDLGQAVSDMAEGSE